MSIALGSIVGSTAGTGTDVVRLRLPARCGGWAFARATNRTLSVSNSSAPRARGRFMRRPTSIQIDAPHVRGSWDHPAFEHLVGDRSGDLVDEGGPHLRVGTQHLDRFLFLLRLRLALPLPELLARRLLVLLDDLV